MEKLSRPTIERGLHVLEEMDGKLLTHLNSCVHCGLCSESCVYYLATGDDRVTPARKVDIVASVYKRYFTLAGKIFPGLVGARELNDDTAGEMIDILYGACSMCGRCNMHCSVGVDIEYVVRKGREMLAEMGLVPATLQSTVDAALKTGNNMAITMEEFVDTLEWLEEDLQDDTGDPDARIPLDKTGVDVLYTLNPREPKFFPLSISAMAKVFWAAGESWSLSTKMYDVTNYAYFSSHPEQAAIIGRRLSDEMKNLGARRCALAECGHGSRAFRWESPNYLGEAYSFETLTSVELLAEYIREGRIRVDKEKITKKVTLHDPCNLVRGGGIFEEQRYILRHCVKNFQEMDPYGYDNLCCGGGGGQLAMSEYNDRRMKVGAMKAEQIRKTGAEIVVTPCHNCVDQLLQVNASCKLNVSIKTLAEIVADALVI